MKRAKFMGMGGDMTKKQKILKYLKRYGSITPTKAFHVAKTHRLAHYINVFRREGMDIITTNFSRCGQKCTRYVLR